MQGLAKDLVQRGDGSEQLREETCFFSSFSKSRELSSEFSAP